jgi:hypothetical protein
MGGFFEPKKKKLLDERILKFINKEIIDGKHSNVSIKTIRQLVSEKFGEISIKDFAPYKAHIANLIKGMNAASDKCDALFDRERLRMPTGARIVETLPKRNASPPRPHSPIRITPAKVFPKQQKKTSPKEKLFSQNLLKELESEMNLVAMRYFKEPLSKMKAVSAGANDFVIPLTLACEEVLVVESDKRKIELLFETAAAADFILGGNASARVNSFQVAQKDYFKHFDEFKADLLFVDLFGEENKQRWEDIAAVFERNFAAFGIIRCSRLIDVDDVRFGLASIASKMEGTRKYYEDSLFIFIFPRRGKMVEDVYMFQL